MPCSLSARWSAGNRLSCASDLALFAISLRITWSNPTFTWTVYTNSKATTEISIQGAHQEEFRRRSVKVLLGAIKELIIREGSERGASPGRGAAAVVMVNPSDNGDFSAFGLTASLSDENAWPTLPKSGTAGHPIYFERVTISGCESVRGPAKFPRWI